MLKGHTVNAVSNRAQAKHGSRVLELTVQSLWGGTLRLFGMVGVSTQNPTP